MRGPWRWEAALQVCRAFVSAIFKTPFQPCFSLITASAAGPEPGAPETMEPLEAGSERPTACCGALLILSSCFENTAPLRWGGKECWTRERRWSIIWARCPQTSQTRSSPGRRPPGLVQHSDLCPVEPASCPAGHIWQPLHEASCWPPGQRQLLEPTAGGSRWGERSWTREPTRWCLPSRGWRPFRGGVGLCPGQGEWRSQQRGPSPRAALSTQLPPGSLAAQYPPSLTGQAPNHSPWEERSLASDRKQQLGRS